MKSATPRFTRPLLFIVPARGGSKGLPGKNIAALAGQPLISYSLSTARAVMGMVDAPGSRLLVSTDDPHIAHVASAWGAETPFLRPAELATDTSVDVDTLLHALDWLREHDGFEPAAVIELQATSPLIVADDVIGALHLFQQTGDTVLSVSASEHSPFWSYTLDDDALMRPVVTGNGPRLRRQDLPATCNLNGAISIISPAVLRAERSFFSSRARGYLMPAGRSVDIDTLSDLKFAETLLAGRDRAVDRSTIQIGARSIGSGQPCFVIAEAGVNHNGSVDLAHQLVNAAADAGADAVKFQTFRADSLCAADTPKEGYQRDATGDSETQLAMLRALELPLEAFSALKQHADERGIMFMSTPFDDESADFLIGLGVSAIKIGSGEVSHLPLLRHVAQSGRPILLSTGMCELSEVAEALGAIREAGDPQVALFHCVSCYPTEPTDCNLRAMETMERVFGLPVGFSDHTLGIEIPLAAIALGAKMIEKHLTLNRDLPGPDHSASLEPAEFRRMVEGIRRVKAALGSGVKAPVPAEEEGRRLGRRSLFAATPIRKGQEIRAEMIAVLRPGTGIHPRELERWVGRIARTDYPAGSPLSE